MNWQDQSGNIIEEQFTANLQLGPASDLCEWRQAEKEFSVSSGELTTLAFLCETGGFFIDDVEVYEKCDDNFLIQNKSYNSMLHGPNKVQGGNMKEEAGQNIVAGTSVGGNGPTGPVVIGYESHVVYTASSSIKFKPGFNAQKGSRFHAALAGCGNNINAREMYGGENTELPKISLNNPANEYSALAVYPNPTRSSFIIKTNNTMEYPKQIIIRDVLGRDVKNMTDVNAFENEIDLSNERSGIYMVTVYYSGSIVSKRVIKE